MGSLKVYATVAGFLALASSVTTARAADLLPPPPPPPLAPEPVADIGGWYLRGDVGVGGYNAGKINHDIVGSSIYDRDFGSSAFAGAGIGYQFNNWFRADVTGEYRFSTGMSWHDKGIVAPAGYMSPGGTAYYAQGIGYEASKTEHSAAIFLVNGYFDLGTWYGLTPFLGAGIGWANHYMRGGTTGTVNAYGVFYDGSGNPLLDGGGNPIRGASAVSGGTIRNKTSGELAWALHAGFAYDVTPNVKLELAYRYLNMGSVRTGIVNCYCGEVYNGFKVKSLESHDIKLGMRWALGGAAPAPVYEPAPLIRKY